MSSISDIEKKINEANSIIADTGRAINTAASAASYAELYRNQAAEYAEIAKSGNTIEELESGGTHTLTQDITLKLNSNTDTITINTSSSLKLQMMTLLYTPSAIRTTPLISTPEGIKLVWANSEEPEWEINKDYIIQLLQIDTNHIEARLFNAPTGVNVGEGDYLIWEPIAGSSKRVLKAARLEETENCVGLFGANLGVTGEKIVDVSSVCSVLRDCTFKSVKDAANMFFNARGNVSLPKATFENVERATVIFRGTNGDINLPEATFENVKDAYQFAYGANNVYLPKATFEKTTGMAEIFPNGGNLFVPWVTGNAVTTTNISFALSHRNKTSTIFTPLLEFANATNANSVAAYARRIFYPSITLAKATNIQGAVYAGDDDFYLPHLNLRNASTANNAFQTLAPFSLRNLKQIVYGPPLKASGTEPVDTLLRDETGNLILSDDGYPVILDPDVVYASGYHAEDDGIRPTGWGIQDFREVDAEGNFVVPYVYKSTGHSITLNVDLNSLGETERTETEKVLRHLQLRGWATPNLPTLI